MEHLNPLIVNDIVCSVPHSGTRTLQDWLKIEKGVVRNTRPDPEERVGHWHFWMHQNKIEDMRGHGHATAHIPLRNPIDVTMSWERRYRDEVGKEQATLNHAFKLMHNFICQSPDYRVKIYKIEDIGLVKGRGPDGDVPDAHPRILALKNWFIEESVVQDFYREYYSEDELWWI